MVALPLDPDGFSNRLGQAIRGVICEYVSDVERANRWLQDINPLTPSVPSGFVRGLLCDRPGPHGLPPNFTGGQCEDVAYFIGLERSDTTRNRYLEQFTVIGPISSVSVSPSGWTSTGVTSFTVTASWKGGSGSDTENFASLAGDTARIYVERADGQPDTCGNPSPPPPPPFPSGGDTVNIDFDYVDNSGQTRNLIGTVNIFAPVLIAPVTINAPISVNLPDLVFDGTIQIAPTFEVNLAPRSDRSPGTKLPETVEGEEPNPDEDQQDCDGRRIIGLSIALGIGGGNRATELAQNGDIPLLGVPRLGYVYFIANVGGESVFLPGIELKNTTQFVIAPDKIPVVCWRVHTEPGVTVLAQRAVYAESEGSV